MGTLPPNMTIIKNSWLSLAISILMTSGCGKKNQSPAPPQPDSRNLAPLALDIRITGRGAVAESLVAHYTYYDAENNPEGGTSLQWYIANDTVGAAVTPVSNATGSTYVLQAANEGKFLRVGIVPGASAGASPGGEGRSYWVGPVLAAEPDTVSFIYNGSRVTYGIIISSVTGRKWLDRNLGAPGAAASYDDWPNKGDLFQWGRGADGHQLINRAATSSGTTAVNGTTTILSSSDAPGNTLFIMPAQSPFDWHSPQSVNLWLESGGINNACPVGWHVPTKTEWEAEDLGKVQEAYARLKITTGGARNFNDGLFSNTINDGLYWSSTSFNGGNGIIAYSFNFSSLAGPAYSSTIHVNATGLSVRCIRD